MMRANQLRMVFLFLATVCMGVFVVGCGQAEIARRAAAFETEGDEIKLLSFNIRYGTADEGEYAWENRRDGVFDLLADQGADVVGLQEAMDFQVREIRRALPVYRTAGMRLKDPRAAGQTCPVLYRRDRFEAAEDGTFWFSNTPWVPGSAHWGNEFPRVCTWVRLVEKATGHSFFVYNLQMDHASVVSREKSAQLLVRQIARRSPAEPVIVVGDFNDDADSPSLRILRGQVKTAGAEGVKLADTWLPAGLRSQREGTYHEFEGRSEGAKTDMILTSPDVEVMWAEIDRRMFGGQYPSDHFPVAALVRLPEK